MRQHLIRQTNPLFALIALLALGLANAANADDADLERLGAWPFGSASAVAADAERQLVFLGSGGAVIAIDVSDPTAPALLSDTIRTPGFVEDLDYDPGSQRLYIAAGEGGFAIWDVAKPETPVELSTIEVLYFDVETPVISVSTWGEFAYVSSSWGYVHWIDVSNPLRPVDRGFNGVGGNPTSLLHAADGYVYACGPRFQAFWIRPDGGLTDAGSRYSFSCHSVFVEGQKAYVGAASLYILDLTRYNFPTLGYYEVGGISDLFVAAPYAYVVNYEGLHILDVSNPAATFEVGSLETPGSGSAVAVAGDHTYVADGGEGLRLIETGLKSEPQEIGSYDTFSVTWGTDIAGRYAFLAENSDGLVVLDLADPTDPVLVGQYDTPGYAYDVAVRGDRAYVADLNGGLRVADISDPAHPVELGSYDSLDAYRLDVQDDHAYVIDAIPNTSYTLRVLDVSDPTAIFETGQVADLGFVLRVVADGAADGTADGAWVYVASWDEGLLILDVSNPASPRIAARYPAVHVWDVAVRDGLAYVSSADWAGGFLILDVSDPTSPSLVSRYNPNGWFHPYLVAIFGDSAYLTRADELFLFDISDPTNPMEVESVVLPLDASRLVAAAGRVFVADSTAGLQVYDDLSTVRAVLDTEYLWDDGERGSDRFTLLTDRTFRDTTSGTGSWSYDPAPRSLRIEYAADTGCEATFRGRVIALPDLSGQMRCADGTDRTGRWRGEIEVKP